MPAPFGSAPSAWVLDGRVIHLTRPSVVDLVPLLLATSPVYLVLSTIRDPEDMAWVYGRILDRNDRFGDPELDDIADALVKRIVGVERWTAEKLWREAHASWSVVDGDLLARGVDITEIDAARATSLLFNMLQKWRGDDKTKLEKWRRDLLTPPKRTMVKPATAESAASAWAQVQALAMGAGQRA